MFFGCDGDKVIAGAAIVMKEGAPGVAVKAWAEVIFFCHGRG